MIVLDHEPYAWFLLEEEGTFYLDVHCSHSAASYSVLIAMNAEETGAWREKGRAWLDRFAHDIHYSAPGVRGTKSPFAARNLAIQATGEAERAHHAIMAWRDAGSL